MNSQVRVAQLSILGFVITETFSKNSAPVIIDIRANGTNIINKDCQLKNCNNAPEAIGPNAGPTKIAQTHKPITEPLFSGGFIAKAVFIIIGISIPVPVACIILEIRSAGKEVENIVHSVPAKNNIIALKNSDFVLKLIFGEKTPYIRYLLQEFNCLIIFLFAYLPLKVLKHPFWLQIQ